MNGISKSIRRPRLTEPQVKLFLWLRYGSLTDFNRVQASFADIARRTGVHITTVHSNIKRWHANGNKFSKDVLRAIVRRSKVSLEQERWLCLASTIYEQRFLSLTRRLPVIERKWGLKISRHLLKQIYRRNNISYR